MNIQTNTDAHAHGVYVCMYVCVYVGMYVCVYALHAHTHENPSVDRIHTKVHTRSQHPDDHEAVLARSVARGMLLARTHPPDSGQTDRAMLRYAAGDLSAHYAQHRDALASQSISAGNVATTASAVSARDHSAITAPPPLFQDPNRTFVVIGEQPGLAEKLRQGGGSVTTRATADSAMQNTIVVLDLDLESTTIDILRYGRCGAMVVSSGACITSHRRMRVLCSEHTAMPTSNDPQTRLRRDQCPEWQC